MESSKRPKAPGSTSQNVQCLVDGCTADLTQCRDYHRRHKVCEFHSKSPTVTIAGREQRFCQQCSRFHSLVEFDDVKRSCRKRLDGHNRRRRKPHPELRHPGSRLMSYSSPQMCSTAGVSSDWASIVKPENDYVMYSNAPQSNWNSSSNTCPESSSARGSRGSGYNAGGVRGGGLNHLQFMQQNNVPPGSRCGGQQTVLHSDSALSLLSSQSAPTNVVGFINPMAMHHHHESMSSPSQTAVHSSRFSAGGGPPGSSRFLFGSDVENKPAISETGSHASNNAAFQFQEMYQNGPNQTSGSGSHQTLTFLWE